VLTGSDHCQPPATSYTLTNVLQSVLPEGTAQLYLDLDFAQYPNVHRIARIACSDLKLFGASSGQSWDLKEELELFHMKKQSILAAVDELEKLSHVSGDLESAASTFLAGKHEHLFQEEFEREVYIKHQCPSAGCGRLF
jgi:hypothetical protein